MGFTRGFKWRRFGLKVTIMIGAVDLLVSAYVVRYSPIYVWSKLLVLSGMLEVGGMMGFSGYILWKTRDYDRG